MSDEVTIAFSFSGIFTVVTGPHDPRHGDAQQALVVMPGGMHSHGGVHRPMLTVHSSLVTAASSPATATIEDPKSGAIGKLKAFLVWDLTGTRVRILPGGFAVPPPLTIEKDGLKDIPAMHDLHAGARFDASSIPKIGHGGPVACAVLLEGGTLRQWETDDPHKYQFVEGKGGTAGDPQSFSDGAILEVEDAPTTVVIELRSHQGTRTIVLTDNETGDIQAAFSNLPLRREAERNDPRITLSHFLSHYDLLENPPASINQFVPVEVVPEPAQGAGTPILESFRCKPGARMQTDTPIDEVWSADATTPGDDAATHHHA